jgi:DNA-binding protein HU-beta
MTTKAEIANRLAEKLKMSRKDAQIAVDQFIDSIRGALLRGEKVALVGFGTFSMRMKRPRQGRNPRTSEAIVIPCKAQAVFKPGKAFRELLGDTTEDDDDCVELERV